MPIRHEHYCPYLKEDFAIRLRRLREDAGYSQKEFAEILGISTQRANRYEKQGMTPDIGLLSVMASSLHVTIDELVGYEPEYDARHTALELLDNAGVEYEYDVDGTKGTYSIIRPGCAPLEMESGVLVSCALEAGSQTCEQLRDTLDSLFITMYQKTFWQAYGWGLYKEDLFNQPYMMTLDDCHETEFSKRLCHYRRKRGLTQTQFAERLGMKNVQTYNRYEMKDAQPSIPLVANMAYILGISVATLTGGEEPAILERALDFLRKVGLDSSQENGKIHMKRPAGLERVEDPEDGLYVDSEIFADVELSETELCYYVAKAWEMTLNTRWDLGTVYNHMFHQLFFLLADSGLPAGPDASTDTAYCLFQQPWSGSSFLMFTGPYETKPVEDS